MSDIETGRRAAQLDGDFVVFLIGASLDLRHPVRSIRDAGGFRHGLKYMSDYLLTRPEKGLLHYEMPVPTYCVQYWRSFEQLEAFARDEDDPHLEAWRRFWERVGTSGRTGVWHETFQVRVGEYEAIYANTARRGLGRAGTTVPLTAQSRARTRLRPTD